MAVNGEAQQFVQAKLYISHLNKNQKIELSTTLC